MTDRRRIYRRLVRILCGKKLPQTWNTVLVLLSIHMYLTVPVILAAGINEEMTGEWNFFFNIWIFHNSNFEFNNF